MVHLCIVVKDSYFRLYFPNMVYSTRKHALHNEIYNIIQVFYCR